MNVKEITPDTFRGPALAGRAWCGFAGNFLVFFNALRCVAVRWSCNVGKIFLTTVSAGRRHGPARIIGGPEGDRAARVAVPEPAPRAGHRSEAFLAEEFFDARDAVQVKYEMVRRVSVDGAPVTAAAAAFGYSRPSYYQAAAALAASGLDGLVPARPGPRGGHKLTGQILAWAEQQLADDPVLKPAGLAGPIAEAFGVHVHPRSIERALARRREHSKSR